MPVAPEDVLDVLGSLVDKSLVVAEEQDGMVRYRLLETVRHYAGERLDGAGEAVAVRGRHLEYCLALAEAADAELRGPREPAWLGRLEQEHDNLRAALRWSLQQEERVTALRLVDALPRFWGLRGHVSEGRQWLTEALTAVEDAPAEVRATALNGAGILAAMHGDYAAARAFHEHSLLLHQQLENARGIAEAQANLGKVFFRQGDFPAARRSLQAALAVDLEVGHKPGIASVHGTLGLLALRQGDHDAARALMEVRLALNRELGNKDGIADALEDLATVAGEEGEYARQAALLEESLTLWRELGDKGGVALALGSLGVGAWARGDSDRARRLLQESLTLYRELGDPRGIARLLAYQGMEALYEREYAWAETLCRESLTLYRDLPEAWAIGRYLAILAAAMFGQGQAERAARLFGAAATLRERLGTPLPPSLQPTHDRTVAAVRASLGEAAFAGAWAAGEAMSPEEAIAYALAGAASAQPLASDP